MKKKNLLLFRLVVLVTAMMCALGAAAAEAYACYTSSNTTLTFYYDDLRSSRTGTTYDLDPASTNPGWETDGTNADVTKVVFDPSFAGARPVTTCDWFYGMENLQSITGMNYLNTSEVINMAWMFGGCKMLTSLDLSSFNTSKLNHISYLFNNCTNLRTIYVGSGWSTAAVATSTNMFRNCTSLVGGQGTTYNDSNPKDMTYAHIDGGTSNPGYFTEWKEAYACYTSGNTTLTFYCDTQRSSRPGTTYDLNTGENYPGWYTDGTNADVTQVVFDPSFSDALPVSTHAWFRDMTKLTTITDIENLNTSSVKDMGQMFMDCQILSSLDVSHFNTEKVTSMYAMFYDCYYLTSIDVSNFNTSQVTNMQSMFNHCARLTSIDVSNFNTANVTTMGSMFTGCYLLSSLDLTSFNTEKVTNTILMFGYSNNLTTIYVGTNWNMSNVTESAYMFYDCTSLVGGQGTAYSSSNPTDKTYAHIDGGTNNPGYFTVGTEAYACYTPSNTTLTFYYDNQRIIRTGRIYDLNTGSDDTGWDTDGTKSYVSKVVFDASFAGARPTTTYDWFFSMQNLESITGMSYLNTSEVTNMAWMFTNCKKLTSLDVSHFNTAKVTDMNSMFGACFELTSLDLSSFNTSKVNSMYNMFFNTKNLQTVYVGSGWSTAAVTSSSDMFYDCTSLVGGQGTAYSSSNPTDKTYAHIDGGTDNPGYFTGPEAYACYTSSNTTLTFYYDTQRSSRTGTTYDLNEGDNYTDWDTDGTKSNVTKVVFDPSFANARPTTTFDWFYGMQKLQSITGMSYLNTSEVTNMSLMFQNCYLLTSLDLSHFNTSKVTDMGGMFSNSTSLTSLDLSSFNTSQVTDMSMMFYGCIGLTSLDLSSFNTSQVTNMAYMFNSNSNLRTIYVGDGWSTAAVTNSNYMFYNCTSLVGGQGTTYSSSNPMDKTYAHIDGGTSNPGYFTDINGPRPYACYTSSNTTLTFYYDTQRSSRPGTTYDLNTGSNDTGWDTDGTNASVTRVVFDPSFAGARPTTTCDWFYDMTNLESITGMEYLNTSEVTDMRYMFMTCSKLTSLDVSHFNTSKVMYMTQMFSGCTGLTSLDLSSFNTSKVTHMRYTFNNSTNLRTIYVGDGWSTAAVTASDYMFYNCTSLVGGQGTTYDDSYVDKTYAHIDGGPSNPGYFTAKNAGLRGDVNGDGHVSIADVSALIDYLLSGETAPAGADCNQSGNVSIADVSSLIDYLLSGQWP